MAGSSSEKAHLLSDGEWLVNMIRNRNSETIRKQPRIGRVSRTLREFKSNETCFNPSVVSLGPYHHHNELLKPMERCKEEAAIWFVSQVPPYSPDSSNQDDKARKIYHHFATEATCASPLKDWYVADESTNKISDEGFTRMMFLDGCFILYFIIDKVVLNRDRLIRENHLHELLIVRDMFLLENQIPYIVLKVLSGLMPGKTVVDKCIEYCISKFFFPSDSDIAQSPLALGPSISIRISPSNKTFSLVNDYEPFHLLDILKFKFTGGREIVYSNEFNNYYFRSIMEHKVAGIKLRRSHYSHLKGISFEESLIFGYLSLPPIIVNKETKSWVLNLIAYEMSPDLALEPGAITTCINFLVSLIQHADDVKELRSKEILLNHLGSDEEVAKLFNEMGNNLMSKLMIYGDVMADIQKHYGYKCKVWFAKVLHTNFSSPWTLSVFGGVFLLFLTIVQTIFGVWPLPRK